MSKIEEIVRKVDFYGLVSKKTQLKRVRGEQYKGLSPFTDEKTASFFINTGTKTWYCFSSGTGGGVIDYVSSVEGLSKEEAVRFLADYTGVELEEQTGEHYHAKRALKLACNYYRQYLEPTVEYMSSRGFSMDVVDTYLLGYADDSNRLLSYLSSNGVSEDHIISSGLAIKEEDGRNYLRYKNRMMIPILDEYGNIISFTGRDLSGNSSVKYLHGPLNALFQKKRIVWGLKPARKLISDVDYVIVTEGQLDAMALVDVGIPAISILGSSVSEEQITALSRLTQNIYFTFDSDEAGERGLFKAFNLVKSLNIDSIIYSIILPKGKDPDEFIHEFGAGEFNSLREEAKSDTESIVQALIKTHYKEGATKTSIAKKVLQELKGSFQQVFTYRSMDLIERISQEFGLNPRELREWVSKGPSFKGGGAVDKKISEMSFPAPIYERRILYSVLKEPGLVNRILNSKISMGDFSSHLVSKVLSSIPTDCDSTEVFDILKDRLSPEDYEKVLSFFSAGISEGDFETSFEILKLKTAQRERKNSVNILGRPTTSTEKELRSVFNDIIRDGGVDK